MSNCDHVNWEEEGSKEYPLEDFEHIVNDNGSAKCSKCDTVLGSYCSDAIDHICRNKSNLRKRPNSGGYEYSIVTLYREIQYEITEEEVEALTDNQCVFCKKEIAA